MIGYLYSTKHEFDELNEPVWYIFKLAKDGFEILHSNSPSVHIGEIVSYDFFLDKDNNIDESNDTFMIVPNNCKLIQPILEKHFIDML